jgi:predicted aspartyl protease
MISGRFGEYGELFFDIELVASNGDVFPVEVLLDTGFTTGYLAINFQDIDALGWQLIRSKIPLATARGQDFFDLYQGKVIIEDREFIVNPISNLKSQIV